MEKDALLDQVMKLDFMLVDLQLYLDTHPDCVEGLETYNKVAMIADRARCNYEKCVGPLYSFRSSGGTGWPWENAPWPWQKEFYCGLNNERS